MLIRQRKEILHVAITVRVQISESISLAESMKQEYIGRTSPELVNLVTMQ